MLLRFFRTDDSLSGWLPYPVTIFSASDPKARLTEALRIALLSARRAAIVVIMVELVDDDYDGLLSRHYKLQIGGHHRDVEVQSRRRAADSCVHQSQRK